MGAIHFAQQDYVAAAKQWRMALDLTPPAYRRLRLNAQRNIGLALVRAGRYAEAADAFGVIMQVRGRGARRRSWAVPGEGVPRLLSLAAPSDV